MGLNWQDIAAHFSPDGTLRDIYVFQTSMEDWESVWTLLARSRDHLTFSVDGVPSEPPTTAAEVFATGAKHSVLAAYAESGFTVNCHFFTQSEIEFDIDPREIGGPDAGEAIARFIAAIGEVTSKPVVLTEENDRSMVIACFDPKTGVIG
jgi:hypothetical protein